MDKTGTTPRCSSSPERNQKIPPLTLGRQNKMVKVTFYNPITQQRLEVDELDEMMTVRETVENLVNEQFVPPLRNGAHYRLAIKGKEELTRDEATLASGHIADGDIINVLEAQRGGQRHGRSDRKSVV